MLSIVRSDADFAFGDSLVLGLTLEGEELFGSFLLTLCAYLIHVRQYTSELEIWPEFRCSGARSKIRTCVPVRDPFYRQAVSSSHPSSHVWSLRLDSNQERCPYAGNYFRSAITPTRSSCDRVNDRHCYYKAVCLEPLAGFEPVSPPVRRWRLVHDRELEITVHSFQGAYHSVVYRGEMKRIEHTLLWYLGGSSSSLRE